MGNFNFSLFRGQIEWNMSDIQQANGISLMNLTNNAGDRMVPFHPKILELGVLDYVDQIENGKHHKLFPNLKKIENTRFGTRISHWFARY